MSRRLRTLGLLSLALSAGSLAAAPPAADGASDAELATHLAQLTAAELAGPNLAERQAGLSGLFPEAAKLERVEVASGRGEIRLALAAEFLASGVDDLFLDAVATWMEAVAELMPGLVALTVSARSHPEEEFRPLSFFLPQVAAPAEKGGGGPSAASTLTVPRNGAPRREAGGTALPDGEGLGHAAPAEKHQPPALGQPQPAGALSGASIFLSPGHGWYWSSTLGRWATQRGNTNNLIEDFSNGEAVLQ